MPQPKPSGPRRRSSGPRRRSSGSQPGGTAELDSEGGYALMVIYKARLFDHHAWCIGSLPAVVGNLSKPQ